ncbi:type II toxin-antitoxin system VapC family toxin [Thermococcus sp. M39]|uniref:type II toxin-antitoxin system VapC family toxin n=1 Tax=unclassified Thermococcus TaxID=2627626 RepID=UPI00143A25B3|nr:MULTISPECIES: PIN domain-containing protein [unclassified Thermococcus]NJE06992.1 type II toxin-antitoxin system VapC family toxin [Thermococcus sp. M39]NJE12885.1 type II toxin-antitoxin system VapC family toxin [Thermococcus sp. LS2]
MPKKNTRFLIDTNVFIAAVKKGWTKTTDLLLYLLTSDYELVGNDVLLAEYKKYAEALNAMDFFEFLRKRTKIVNPSREEVLKCLKYFPLNQVADAVHAATCLKTRAVIITNDKHFEKIGKEGLIEVWKIEKAIKELLQKE